jgi:chitin disaccharide deacetylase
MAGRLLIVNADDFGFTRGVNAGIVDAHRNGILTATTLMANGDAFDDAVRLAKETPSLDVGCHLVLIGGKSLVADVDLPASPAALVRAVFGGNIPIYEELSAQVRKIAAAGIAPTHLDTHKHTHLLPPVLDAVARISRETGIRWVRSPFDAKLNYRAPRKKRIVGGVLRLLRGRTHSVLRKYGCRSTDFFAGFQITGRFTSADLINLFAELPEGCTEFMCHPGYLNDELHAAPTRLKHSRADELAALTAPETREALSRYGIRLTSYRDLDV